MLPIKEYLSSERPADESIVTWYAHHWPNYEICVVDGNEYVVGTYVGDVPNLGVEISGDDERNAEYQDRMHDLRTSECVFTKEMLIFLLECAEKVHHDQHRINEVAISICRELGMVCDEEPRNRDESLFCIPHSVYQGMSISALDGMLDSLYSVYECWLHLVWGEPLLSIYSVLHFMEYCDETKSILRSIDESNPSAPDRMHTPFYDDACRGLILGYLGEAQCSLSYWYGENERLHSRLVCVGLYSAALVSLGIIISLGNLFLDGRCVAACSNCGAEFIKKHGNSKLCENCKTNKAKLKAFRLRQKEKKEAASHAQQEK